MIGAKLGHEQECGHCKHTYAVETPIVVGNGWFAVLYKTDCAVIFYCPWYMLIVNE